MKTASQQNQTNIQTHITMNRTCHDFTTRSSNALLKRTAIPALLGLLLVALPALAGDDDDRPRKVIPFSDARIRIEVNATDQDSGLHVLLDAEGWRWVKIYDPRGRLVFYVMGGGGVRKTGLTELFFESAEPGFDELPLVLRVPSLPALDPGTRVELEIGDIDLLELTLRCEFRRQMSPDALPSAAG